jgi:UDP-2,3-diacylglucosamine pyrophosphatase LpxH
MKAKTHYRTIVVSDVHLGSSGSKAVEVVKFLKKHTCDKLILNGDIIDGWQLKKSSGKWERKHTRFFRRVLKMIEKRDTDVIYIRGNHDDFLDQVLPFRIGNFRIQKNYILKGAKGDKFYVTHGDVFDSITSNMKWLAHLGDIGYTFLLWINKIYNQYRERNGLSYYSISQVIKQKVKMAVNYVSDFEEKISELAKVNNCVGIIVGHIHQPAIKDIQGIQYMNSGDWVESLSALVEDFEGNWQLIYYNPADYVKEDGFKEIKLDFKIKEVINYSKSGSL